MQYDEEEKDMLAAPKEISSLRKPKHTRTNLLSSANTQDIKFLNEKTKKNRGLSNLTYQRVFGED